MYNSVFGDVAFDYGWKTETEITLWERTFAVTVDADAFYETEGITAEQEAAFSAFNDQKAEKQRAIESLLMSYYEDRRSEEQLLEQLTPTQLTFDRKGGCALLFTDEDDLDNGLAVTVFPDEDVMTQDEFL